MSGIIKASSLTVAQLIVGRIVAGVGLGLITSNLALWRSKTTASNIRGTLNFLIWDRTLHIGLTMPCQSTLAVLRID
jgi:hypothetical protein